MELNLTTNTNILFFDVETTILNKGNYADPRNFLVSFSLLAPTDKPQFSYYTDADFISKLSSAIAAASTIVGFNVKFDLHWCLNLGISVPLTTKIWDLQLAEFIYSGQELPYDSLNDALQRYGLPVKPDLVKEYWERGISTEHIPVPILQEYNNYDVSANELLFNTQQNLLSDQQKALTLIEGEDLRTLLHAEHAGIVFDTEEAMLKTEEYGTALETIEAELNTYLPEGIPSGTWNWDSGDHLSALLYGGVITFEYAVSEPAIYKSGDKKGQAYTRNRWFSTDVHFTQRFKPIEGTEVKKTKDNPAAVTRFYQTDAPTLSQLKTRDKASKRLLELLAERSDKTKVTEMIESIMNKMTEKNWQDNIIHPQYNQNVVITGRLSSSQPNMQNTSPEIDKLLISRYD